MKPTKDSLSTIIQEPIPQITDVVEFFSEITDAYKQFQKDILHLQHKIPTSSPQQILEGCKKIRKKQTNLEALDQQMIDIINFVGKEIAHEPIVHDYRMAFAQANMACTNLYQNLKALKCSLE